MLAQALERVGIDAWGRPELLPFGMVAAGLVFVLALARPERGMPWPAFAEARAAGLRRFDAQRVLSALLRASAIAALLAVFAEPAGLHRAPPPPGEGLDLVLVVDASDSMRALDAQVGGAWRSRLELARAVVARFAEKRAAAGDRVGLVVFGDAAFTQSPLTSDGALLAAGLARVEAGMAGESTALGDALALAVRRVSSLSSEAAGAGRVVVLLTDGRHNSGSLAPDVAARLAAGAGVRVHTVAIGSLGEAVAMPPEPGAAQPGLRFERHDVDPEALERIARTTGGTFHAARRSSDLAAVYAALDSLERVARQRPARLRHDARPEPLLALAGLLLSVEIALARALHRRQP